MSRIVQIEETIHLPHLPQAVWPALSRTDWINRAIGLPPVTYNIQPRPEGGSFITATTSFFGWELSWEEHPFEWTEPKFYQVRRIFKSGPLAECILGLRFQEAVRGCDVQAYAYFTPRNAMGEFITDHLIGPKTLRDMRGLIQHLAAQAVGHETTLLQKLPTTPPNLVALNAGLQKMRAAQLPDILVERLGRFLTKAPDVELSHIRPFAVAQHWEVDRWEVLRLFLHATRAGLLNLSWEVLCPNCRSTRMPRNTSLQKLTRAAHCEVCNIRFDAEFDKSVELKFSVHPSVRPCDEQTYCLIGPGGKPHIISQIVIEPGANRVWDVPELKREHLFRSPQVGKTGVLLPSNPRQGLFDTEIICHAEEFHLRLEPAKTNVPAVRVFNPNPFPVQIALEGSERDDEILTAARVTNWQEFRDLFASEVISPTEQVSVGSQVLLFTDLLGSTTLYGEIGDALAYVLVRDHFKILHDAVAAHHGGVVKTIGDAVMATFSNLPEALAAVQQMHEQLARTKAGNFARLRLKSALHAGSCLAVNANERLDFFGTTVNLAARLVENCAGDDLTMTNEVYLQAEVQDFLRRSGKTGVPGEKRFQGFVSPIKLWRIPMLSAKSDEKPSPS